MHQDLQVVETNLLGMMRNAGGHDKSVGERVEQLASCVHDLLRVVSDALDALDHQRRARRHLGDS